MGRGSASSSVALCFWLDWSAYLVDVCGPFAPFFELSACLCLAYLNVPIPLTLLHYTNGKAIGYMSSRCCHSIRTLFYPFPHLGNDLICEGRQALCKGDESYLLVQDVDMNSRLSLLSVRVAVRGLRSHLLVQNAEIFLRLVLLSV